MAEGQGKQHRASVKERSGGTKDRRTEERRRLSESLLRRQRGAALNARRKQKLLELQKEAEDGAPIIFSDDEMREAVRGAVDSVRQPSDLAEHLRHLRYLRYLLTDSEDPPIQLIANLEVVPLLMTEMAAESSDVRGEALWALAFLAEADLASAQKLLPSASQFVPYLSGEDAGYDAAELAAWLFRSLASAMTSEEQFPSVEVAAPLARLIFAGVDASRNGDGHVVDVSMTAAWALCSLVAHSGAARRSLLVEIPHFATRLTHLLTLENGRVVTEAAWLITYLVAADDAHLRALIQANVVAHLVALLKIYMKEEHPVLNTAYEVLTPVLRSLGNIAAGVMPEQVKELIRHEDGVILKCMAECLTCDHRGIQKEACKVLANLAIVGDASVIEAFDQSTVLEKIIHFVGHSAFDIKREAAFILANICFAEENPNVDFLKYMMNQEHQIVPGIVSLMRGVDVDAIKLGLDFSQLILESIPDGPQRFEEADGIDALDNLQFGEVPAELQDMASYLVDVHFGEDYGLN